MSGSHLHSHVNCGTKFISKFISRLLLVFGEPTVRQPPTRRADEGRRAKGEGRRAKGEGRRAKGEGRRAKGEGRRAKGEGLFNLCTVVNLHYQLR